MSIPKYPPKELISPMKINKNYEQIILWMLYNNNQCTWSDLKSDPVNISNATLSKYLNILTNSGFIDKEKKGTYKITSEGRKYYAELQVKDMHEEILNYPPDKIKRKRDYEDCILWMLYNNEYCKWSDFLEDPININQSSLSKSLNALQQKDFIEKDNREYHITNSGELEYFNMLKKYDLDRQSILDEETKRVEFITDKVAQFFDEYKITDDGVKYRFLNMIMRLDYTKFEATLSDELDFNKILLFLSINHPDNYPNYITLRNFALEYDISVTTLNFFVEKIVEDKLYAIKFFKLNVGDKFTYYIQAEERLEKILNVIIEDYIRRFTYLSKFQKKGKAQDLALDINKLLEDISNDICSNLFHEELKPSLKKFLPEYIEHLAYKFETEKSLIDHTDKIKSIAFQNVFEVIQSFGTTDVAITVSKPVESDSFYFLHNRIFDTLEIIYLSKLDFFRMLEFKKDYFPLNTDLLTAIEDKLSKGSLTKVNDLLTNNIENLNEIELMILRDIIYTNNGEFEESIKLNQKIIDKYPNEYIGYLFQSVTYFLMGKFKDAINIADVGLSKSSNILLIVQKAQILINYDHDKAVKIIDEVFEDNSDNFALIRTKFLTVMTDKECCIGAIDEPLELINSLIDSSPKDSELLILKALLFIVNHKYKEAKSWIKNNIKPNVFEDNPRIDIAAYLVLAYSYLARGKFEKALNMGKKAEFHYPNHPLSHIIKGFIHGFNLVYDFDSEKANPELFKNGFRKAISLQQSEKKLSRYYQLYSYILNETEGLEEALDAINKAIELSPEHYDIYQTKAHLYLTFPDKLEDSFKFYDELHEKFPHEDKEIRQLTSFSYFATGKIKEGIDILEESLKLYPDSIGMLNNLAIFKSSLGNFNEAIEIIEKAITIDPTEANLLDTYGEVLMYAKQYEDAIVKFTQALEMNPVGWFAFHTFLKLAECYKALGMEDKSDTCFNKAKELTEKVIPGKRKLYIDKLEESIEELGKIPL